MQFLAQIAQPTPDPTGPILAGMAAMSGVILIAVLVSLLFTILVYFMIFKRTGMNPWLSLLMLVPIANFVMLIILAFTEWPIQREVHALRAQLAGTGGMTMPPGAGFGTTATAYGTPLPPPGTPPATT
jgi:branched-subunit amino acid transport protein AzlD